MQYKIFEDSLSSDSLQSLNIDSALSDSLQFMTQNIEHSNYNWLATNIVLLVLITIYSIGYIGINRSIKRTKSNINDIDFFFTNLKLFLECQGNDMNAYSWLIDRSVKIQNIMGPYGKITFVAPYTRFKYTNYDIVINFVPKIKDEFRSTINQLAPSDETLSFYVDRLQESILRVKGVLSDELYELQDANKNIFKVFIRGINSILTIPIALLIAFDLFSESAFRQIRRSWYIRLLTLIVTLFTLLGTIMTIILGWDKFWDVVIAFFR
jgi:hypothetical protein